MPCRAVRQKQLGKRKRDLVVGVGHREKQGKQAPE